MAIVWKNSEAFEKHDEQMRMFRQAHPNNFGVRVSRRDLINTMWPLLVTNTVRDTGGSTDLTSTMDWSFFVPLGEVTTRRFSSN